MRVLVVPFPWQTHVFNLVPPAWALQAAGHEVRMAVWPDQLDAVTGAGLTGVVVGPGESAQQRALRDRRRSSARGPAAPQSGPAALRPAPADLSALFDIRPHRERLGWPEVSGLFEDLVLPQAQRFNDPMADDLIAYARRWRPDLVLWGAKAFAGALAAAAVGAVHARVLYSVDVYPRMRADYLHAMAGLPTGERVDVLGDWLAGWAHRHGFAFDEDLVNGQFTVDPLPDAFRPDPRAAMLPMQFVPYNGPAVVPDWLSGTEREPAVPRVLMTFGDAVNDGPVRLLLSEQRVQQILDAVADLDIELVLTLPRTSWGALRQVPANTRLVESVPLSEVLPTCSAMVHHGGAWSFGCALRYGVPQLLVSQAFDAPLKFACLERAGAGLAMRPGEADGPAVRAALVRLLDDPAIRAGAARLGEEVRAMPSPNELARTLEEAVTAAGARRAA
ncbi:nucleotide disphospho-sugar-binding domain-containing protein [Streptomyces sp. NPDC088387]|uniref:nucleotide disphospho-sugar-binding domain-containing protein n=1 Tax=Streptomyces sp. NPDC088387 TaxID=3365859 RepID=UPI0037F7F4DC